MARARKSSSTTTREAAKPPAVADSPRRARSARPPIRHVLSSGLFGLPAQAHSVDWALLNDSPYPQTCRVTVYRVGIGSPKTPVAPGSLNVTVAPSEATHNANTVGTTFLPGFYFEVVVETDDLRVLPSVTIWQDAGNTVIPGTLISPGTFGQV